MTYEDLISKVYHQGSEEMDRTGTGTRSLFAESIQYDLSQGFPLITTKKVFWKGAYSELFWMLTGQPNIQYLKDRNVAIWDAWATPEGDVGPVYGVQWRNWTNPNGEKVDQIANLESRLKTDPNCRRLICNAWNVGEIEDMALPPCPVMFQLNVRDGEHLDMMLTQRSADLFLGVPFDIAVYSLLLSMFAHVSGLTPGIFTHNIGNAHIYLNHLEQIEIQMERHPFPFPSLSINPECETIDQITEDDLHLEGYQHHDALKGKVSV